MGNSNPYSLKKSYFASSTSNRSKTKENKLALNPIHQGPILGISCCSTTISNHSLYTCSDDNKAALVELNSHGNQETDIKVIKYFEGHAKAVNKVLHVNSSNESDSSRSNMIWTASRDLSLKLVSEVTTQ